MKQKKKSDVAVLLDYAGSHKGLTFLGLTLSAVSMLLSMAPYICIWLVARDLIAVAPDWTRAQDIAQYGWLAFAFAVAGIVLYFAGLMCTHLAAFRTAANIRKQGVAHVMKAPLGFHPQAGRRPCDESPSGLLRLQRLWSHPGTAGCGGGRYRDPACPQSGGHRRHHHPVCVHAGADVRL